MEGYIRVASRIQEHKTGSFNTTADVKMCAGLISIRAFDKFIKL